MSEAVLLTLLVVGSYLVGSIPFGVIVARAAGVDILCLGSGNPGATNVWRILGWRFGLPVFALDVAKGVAPPVAAFALGFDTGTALLMGVAAVLGHCASPFLGFKGGKGVATIFGASLGATPLLALSGFGVFVLTLLITRLVSLSSMIAVLATALLATIWGMGPVVVGVYIAAWFFVIYRHRSNIQRLLRREEPKFDLKGGSGKRKLEEDLPPVEEREEQGELR